MRSLIAASVLLDLDHRTDVSERIRPHEAVDAVPVPSLFRQTSISTAERHQPMNGRLAAQGIASSSRPAARYTPARLPREGVSAWVSPRPCRFSACFLYRGARPNVTACPMRLPDNAESASPDDLRAINTLSNSADRRSPRSGTVRGLCEHDQVNGARERRTETKTETRSRSRSRLGHRSCGPDPVEPRGLSTGRLSPHAQGPFVVPARFPALPASPRAKHVPSRRSAVASAHSRQR
jgi:hypothetical protein